MQVAKEGWSAQICVCTESDYSFVSFFQCNIYFHGLYIMCASELQIVVVADVLPKSIFGNFFFFVVSDQGS